MCCKNRCTVCILNQSLLHRVKSAQSCQLYALRSYYCVFYLTSLIFSLPLSELGMQDMVESTMFFDFKIVEIHFFLSASLLSDDFAGDSSSSIILKAFQCSSY